MRKYKTPVLRFVSLNSTDIIATSDRNNAPRMSTDDAEETDETGNFML